MANLSDFIAGGGGGSLNELEDVQLRALFDQERLTFDDFSDFWINDYGDLIVRSLPSGDLFRIDVDDEGNLSTTLLQRAIEDSFMTSVDGTDIGLPVTFNTNLSNADLARFTGWDLTCQNPDGTTRQISAGTLPDDTYPGTFTFTEAEQGIYNYRLTLFSSDGAHSITDQQIRFFAPPVVVINAPVFANGNTEVTLTTTVTDADNPMGPFTYVWVRNGTVIAGETGSSIMVTNDAMNSANGLYRVNVTDPDGRGGFAELDVNLNGPVAASLEHQGSVLINMPSTLVASISDADGDANLGAWSIDRTRGSVTTTLFQGTGALDGTTNYDMNTNPTGGIFSITNGGDEDVDDVYRLRATDVNVPPHTVESEVTVDIINMSTVTVNFVLAGTGPGRTLNTATQRFTGIPGGTFSGSTTGAVGGTNRFQSSSCSADNTAVITSCNTSNGLTASFNGTYPNTDATVTITVTINSIADLPDLNAGGSGNRISVSNGVPNTAASWSVRGCGISRNGTATLNASGSTSTSYDDSQFTRPACPNSCSVVVTWSQAGRDSGSATIRTETSSRPQFTPNCTLPSFPIRSSRGQVNSIDSLGGFGVAYNDCAGTIVPSGWSDILFAFANYSCTNGFGTGNGRTSTNPVCTQTSGTNGVIGTGFANSVTGSGGRCIR